MEKTEFTTDEIELIIECLEANVNSGFVCDETQDRIIELLEKLNKSKD